MALLSSRVRDSRVAVHGHRPPGEAAHREGLFEWPLRRGQLPLLRARDIGVRDSQLDNRPRAIGSQPMTRIILCLLASLVVPLVSLAQDVPVFMVTGQPR